MKRRAAWWTDELEAFSDALDRFVRADLQPYRETWRRDGRIPRDVWRSMGAMGMLCPTAPAQWGGTGGSFGHEAVVIEAIERGAPELSAAVQVHSAIMSNYIVTYGTDEQRTRWLPPLIAGEVIGAIAMTEAGTGSDLKAIRTTAKPNGDGYVVNGQKTFITNGDEAELIIVVAQTASERPSLLVVDRREMKGVTSRRLDKIGMHASDTAEIFFDDVEVPNSNRLGEEGRAMSQLMAELPRERLAIAVAAAEAAEKAVDLATDYAKQRKAFGSALIDLQNTAFRLAELRTEARVARVFVDDCIGRELDGSLDNETAAMAKLYATERLGQVVDGCLQIHGGYGYMAEYEIGRMYSDARALRIYGGSSEIMKLIISRSL